MKKLVYLMMILLGIGTQAQQTQQKVQVVEASCGQCQFHMKDKKGCDGFLQCGPESRSER